MSLSSRIKSALEVLSTIVVILAASVLIWTLLSKNPAATSVQGQVQQVNGLRIEANLISNASGAGQIAIVEFSDFHCPYCAKHAKDVLPTIEQRFIDSGGVRYVPLNFPVERIHPLALRASEVAECAGKQGKFWPMRKRLFDSPDALTDADLVVHAQVIGLDHSRLKRCVEDRQTLEAIRAHQAEGRRLGVEGTPVFFVGKIGDDGGIDLVTRIRGAADANVFAEQVERLRSSQSGRWRIPRPW